MTERTKILHCICSNHFQDKFYGKNKRLHNITSEKSTIKEWKCTVCGTKKK